LLANFTEQGIRKIKDSPKRADAFKNMAKKCGATVKDVFWTLGEYDIVAVVEAPDDVSITALGLSTGALGNVRTRPCERLRRPTWGQSLTRWSRVEFRAAGPSCCRCWSPNVTRRKHHGARTNGGKPCPSPATKKGCCRLHGGASGSGGPSGKRNGQYRHSERTKVAIASSRNSAHSLKCSALA
jgi:uncharacterized protein with GYD domain